MRLVLSGNLRNHPFNVLHAASALTHSLCRVVGVTARAIPVREQLGGKRDSDVEVFSDSVKDVARHMHVVANSDTFNGTNLIFPLAWHHFGIRARDLDARIEAGSVVSIGYHSAKAVAGTNRAVVGALLTWVAIVRPAQRPSRKLGLSADKGVFLFDSEPGLFVGGGVHDLLGMGAEVCVSWLEVLASGVRPSVGLCHDEQVVALSEGVAEVGDWAHDDLGVVSLSLVAGRTIVIPLRQVSKGGDFTRKCPALGAKDDAAAVEPDVLAHGHVVDLGPRGRVVDVLVVQGEVLVV